MREQTDLQQVWFVVSPQNPFKKAKNLLNEYDRLRMVELAVEDNYDLRACNIEFSMPKPSYTADTLAYLGEQHPTHNFHLILGSDNLTHFHRWKNHRAIIDHHVLYVYPRPDVSSSKIAEEINSHPNRRFVEAPLLNISATFIRNLLQQDRSVQYLVPNGVADYIRTRSCIVSFLANAPLAVYKTKFCLRTSNLLFYHCSLVEITKADGRPDKGWMTKDY